MSDEFHKKTIYILIQFPIFELKSSKVVVEKIVYSISNLKLTSRQSNVPRFQIEYYNLYCQFSCVIFQDTRL